MIRHITAIFLVLCAISCSPRIYPASRIDSVRVEYRERIIHDTIRYEIPVEVEKVVTHDTTSTLTNSIASSTAKVHNGLLEHSLQTLKKTINVPAQIVVRDTVIIEKKGETIVKEVPAALSRWQNFLLSVGRLALKAIVLAIALLVAKRLLKIIS